MNKLHLAMNTDKPRPVSSSISEVERDVGVAKETLRVWERRYGFPLPQRDAKGERVYPPDQVQRLSHVKRLLDQGYRPGKIIKLDLEQLAALGAKPCAGPPCRGLDDPEIAACIALLEAHQLTALRARLNQALRQSGLQRCVMELLAPLTTAVGVAWADGRLAVFEEHLYAELLQTVLRSAIRAAAAPADAAPGRPRILLSTVPQERHGLGLLMAEALFVLEGADCISLGLQTPLGDIVDAARTQQADIVALSFSAAVSARAVRDNVAELRQRLGAPVQVWAGGSGAAQARPRLGPGTVLDLAEIAQAVAAWRSRQSSVAI